MTPDEIADDPTAAANEIIRLKRELEQAREHVRVLREALCGVSPRQDNGGKCWCVEQPRDMWSRHGALDHESRCGSARAALAATEPKREGTPQDRKASLAEQLSSAFDGALAEKGIIFRAPPKPLSQATCLHFERSPDGATCLRCGVSPAGAEGAKPKTGGEST